MRRQKCGKQNSAQSNAVRELLAADWRVAEMPKRAFKELLRVFQEMAQSTAYLQSEIKSKADRAQLYKEVNACAKATQLNRLVAQLKAQQQSSKRPQIKVQELLKQSAKRNSEQLQNLANCFYKSELKFAAWIEQLQQRVRKQEEKSVVFKEEVNSRQMAYIKIGQDLQRQLRECLSDHKQDLSLVQINVADSLQAFKKTMQGKMQLFQNSQQLKLQQMQAKLSKSQTWKMQAIEALDHKFSSFGIQHSSRLENVQLQCHKRQLQQVREMVACLEVRLGRALTKDKQQRLTMADVMDELDQRPSKRHLDDLRQWARRELDSQQQLLAQQGSILKDLCQQNVVGKWAWKQFNLQKGAVVWDQLIANTFPQNFSLDLSKIKILNPGIYEVDVGFFSGERPEIRMSVNGEQVALVKKEDWRLRGHLRLAFSFREILFLEKGSELQVSFQGENAEGFIALRRL